MIFLIMADAAASAAPAYATLPVAPQVPTEMTASVQKDIFARTGI
jgi:hypothetical protein